MVRAQLVFGSRVLPALPPPHPLSFHRPPNPLSPPPRVRVSPLPSYEPHSLFVLEKPVVEHAFGRWGGVGGRGDMEPSLETIRKDAKHFRGG